MVIYFGAVVILCKDGVMVAPSTDSIPVNITRGMMDRISCAIGNGNNLTVSLTHVCTCGHPVGLHMRSDSGSVCHAGYMDHVVDPRDGHDRDRCGCTMFDPVDPSMIRDDRSRTMVLDVYGL